MGCAFASWADEVEDRELAWRAGCVACGACAVSGSGRVRALGSRRIDLLGPF